MPPVLRAFADGTIFGDAYGSDPSDVLALHGWRRDRSDFREVLAGLDAIALDLPGFGASPAPPTAWGAAEYAHALEPVLEQMAPRAVIVGHSFGGRVAVHLAASFPDRVAGVVLAGVPLMRVTTPPKPALSFRIAKALNRVGLLSDGEDGSEAPPSRIERLPGGDGRHARRVRARGPRDLRGAAQGDHGARRARVG